MIKKSILQELTNLFRPYSMVTSNRQNVLCTEISENVLHLPRGLEDKFVCIQNTQSRMGQVESWSRYVKTCK